ncbi:MAG: acyl-CoA dehydrogenase family protein, partial [Proteobacteria bacterium]|nr:acyl-CoA dehydrogenase family protein [Pseudomonadota bacterium]
MLLALLVSIMLTACSTLPVGMFSSSANRENPAAYEEALALMDSGHLEAAETTLLRLTKRYRRSAGPWINLSIIYARTQRHEQAEAALNRALELDPRSAVAYNHLGILLRRDGRFEQADQAYAKAIRFDPEYGGMGLPYLVTTAIYEIWHAANMAFALCPTLTQAAVELLSVHGSDDLKAVFMEKLVSGVWAGTMNLTEPQAGSDLSQIRTQAVREGERYLITGQKIFITHGEHDFTENIVHMVLARTPGGADGIKGLSLFVVPKFLVKDDGALGPRNDLRCLSLEHKMGINASPTCVMSFGEDGGAEGYLVGEENRGIEYMFTMMNNARLAIGLQGVGVA